MKGTSSSRLWLAHGGSYQLLSAQERRVRGELSVFAGTFGLEQVAEMCGSGDQLSALEVIDRLVGKSWWPLSRPRTGPVTG